MRKQLLKIENIIFICILMSIIVLNIYGSIFMLASYWCCLDKNKIVQFIIAIMISCLITFLYRRTTLARYKVIIVFIAINTISLIIRILVCKSFLTYPASDQWQLINALIGMANYNSADALNTGGYLNIYSNNALCYYLYYPFVKLIDTNYQLYYVLNAFLVQISFILLGLFVWKQKGEKASLLSSVVLNLFIPSYFMSFVVYGDIPSLVLISLGLFSFAFIKNSFLKYITLSLFIGLSYIARATSIVWIVAVLIVILLFEKEKIKKALLILLCVITFLLPSAVSKYSIEKEFNVDLDSNSMPVQAWIYIGTGYSIPGDAGIFNPLPLNTLSETNYNSNETARLLNSAIIENLTKLKNPKELVLFVKRKIQNTWTDPDFESMGFVMPNSGYNASDFKNGYRIPVGTGPTETTYKNALGQFVYDNFQSIRNIEKIYLFIILLWLLYSSVLRCKKNKYDAISLFLELNLVGMFFLQLILETKPRYVFVSFVMVIVCSCLWGGNSNE